MKDIFQFANQRVFGVQSRSRPAVDVLFESLISQAMQRCETCFSPSTSRTQVVYFSWLMVLRVGAPYMKMRLIFGQDDEAPREKNCLSLHKTRPRILETPSKGPNMDRESNRENVSFKYRGR
eukprot:TRINITY_DN74887_c0_g1_i1.p1 TRINITY_DN74887_c0_g1~~TRINITY_DN74887_c0_g1_i1.p1  ORF type:complete len:122 (-),score=2.11 TRINITY_DN74887_c0_g1_i1:101-466(-)